jgi:glutamate formiminotransferase/formiminotetrahydrofolate cyclodeaminase
VENLVECIPNFSEGKDIKVVKELIGIIEKKGAEVINYHMDEDHNRTVITFIGSFSTCLEAAFVSCKHAQKMIDLRKHKGIHPRIGATDVIPFVPIQGISVEECIEGVKKLGKRIAEELKIPVYLYDKASPSNRRLSEIRGKGFEELQSLIKTHPSKVPDFGKKELHPTAGAVSIGVRDYLIAYNINLNTQNVEIAKNIAKIIRSNGGIFRNIKALGFYLEKGKKAQVSINITNYKETSIFRVFEFVKKEAQQWGVEVEESEVVGVIPLDAIVDTAKWYLRLRDFSKEKILEYKLKEKLPYTFITNLGKKTSTPGGGAVSALCGAQGAALVKMVCEFTIGKEKYKQWEKDMIKVAKEADKLKNEFLKLAHQDEVVFNNLMEAYKLPKEKESEKKYREKEIQKLLKEATLVPLEVIKKCKQVVELAYECANKGNVYLVSDAGIAAVQGEAGAQSGIYNVKINTPNIKDKKFKEKIEKETEEILKEISKLREKVEKVVKRKM